MPMLRLTLIALAVTAFITGIARACNEECTAGFMFDDREGVCVRGDMTS